MHLIPVEIFNEISSSFCLKWIEYLLLFFYIFLFPNTSQNFLYQRLSSNTVWKWMFKVVEWISVDETEFLTAISSFLRVLAYRAYNRGKPANSWLSLYPPGISFLPLSNHPIIGFINRALAHLFSLPPYPISIIVLTLYNSSSLMQF